MWGIASIALALHVAAVAPAARHGTPVTLVRTTPRAAALTAGRSVLPTRTGVDPPLSGAPAWLVQPGAREPSAILARPSGTDAPLGRLADKLELADAGIVHVAQFVFGFPVQVQVRGGAVGMQLTLPLP